MKTTLFVEDPITAMDKIPGGFFYIVLIIITTVQKKEHRN